MNKIQYELEMELYVPMKKRELINLGCPHRHLKLAIDCLAAAARERRTKANLRKTMKGLVAAPRDFVDDAHFGPLAQALLDDQGSRLERPEPGRSSPAPYKQWVDNLDEKAVPQMDDA